MVQQKIVYCSILLLIWYFHGKELYGKSFMVVAGSKLDAKALLWF
jgi:hypothetical protein